MDLALPSNFCGVHKPPRPAPVAMAPGPTDGEDPGAFFAMPPPPIMTNKDVMGGPPQGMPHHTMPSPMTAGPNGQPWSKFSFANFDWSIYDYHPQDDGGFWQLQAGIPPSDQLPPIIPLSVTKRFPVQQSKDAEWTCLGPACPSKPFRHKGDLERHYKQAHPNGVPSLLGGFVTTPTFENMPPLPVMPPNAAVLAPAGGVSPATQDSSANGKEVKEKEAVFYCDYAPCPRKSDGFNRKDRFRQHLQDTHKEDVVKKGGTLEDEWLDGRKMSDKWWRCSKCLERVKVEEHGWECPRDQVKCETRRREYRERLSLG